MAAAACPAPPQAPRSRPAAPRRGVVPGVVVLGKLSKAPAEAEAEEDVESRATTCPSFSGLSAISVGSALREDSPPGARTEDDLCRAGFALEVDPQDLILEEQIAKGRASEVFRADLDGQIVAVKRCLKRKRMLLKEQIAFSREVETLERMSHPNLVKLIGVCMLSHPFQLVTEFCEGGNMYELLHDSYEVELSWVQRVKMCADVATAMAYLHSREPQVIHRDLTSLNLLLAQPVRGPSDEVCVKVGNFGFARTRDRDSRARMTSDVGTLVWIAPEILRGDEYDEKVDVYSYGVVLFEVVCRQPPFEDLDEVEFERTVKEGGRPDLDNVPQDCPQELVKVMMDCWAQKPASRPDFASIRARIGELQEEIE